MSREAIADIISSNGAENAECRWDGLRIANARRHLGMVGDVIVVT
jgi:hypothetical protein